MNQPGLFDPDAYDNRSEALRRRMRNLQQLAIYYRSPYWRRFRWYIILLNGRRCQACRRVFPPERLQVHHISYANLYAERIDDVLLLCLDCHARRHRHRRGTTGPGRTGPGRAA